MTQTNSPQAPNQYEDKELRETVCKIFNVFPEELEFDLPGGIGTKKVEALEQLIAQKQLEARIDEVDKATDRRYSGIAVLKKPSYLRERKEELLAELTKQEGK